MMNGTTERGSDLLIQHWQKGTTLDELPQDVRPSDTAHGYGIQRHFEQLSNKPLFGWKIAATSAAGQKHINVTRPLAGRILSERVSKIGDSVPLGPNRMQVAELEFVFQMGKALKPRPTPYETAGVMDAVSGLFLGVEVPDSRYSDFTKVGAAQLIADNACADRFVLGQEVKSDWRSKDLSAHIVRGRTSNGVERVGSGGEVLGDPRLALTWIANELSDHGVALDQGQFVTTGTCIVPMPVKPGVSIEGDFGDFGTINVNFEA